MQVKTDSSNFTNFPVILQGFGRSSKQPLAFNIFAIPQYKMPRLMVKSVFEKYRVSSQVYS